MGESIAKLVLGFLKQNDEIRACLERDLINHAALARKISDELQLTAKEEAICIALRRYVQRRGKRNRITADVVSNVRSMPIYVSFRTGNVGHRSRPEFTVNLGLASNTGENMKLLSAVVKLLQFNQIAADNFRIFERSFTFSCAASDLQSVIALFNLADTKQPLIKAATTCAGTTMSSNLELPRVENASQAKTWSAERQ